MSDPKKIYLIYSPAVADRLQHVSANTLVLEHNIQVREVKLAEAASIHIGDDLSHVLLWIEQEHYPSVLQLAYNKKMTLGFLPVAGDVSSQFFRNLDLPGNFQECLDIAVNEQPFAMDLIQCNGEIVTNGVNLVNQTTMAEFIGDSEAYQGWRKIEFQFKRIVHAFALSPHPVTLMTGKGKTVSTAITGMLLLDFHKKGALLNLFKDSVSLRDRRISVVLFAPQSILSYLKISSSTFLKSHNREIFQQLGYIRTESLIIKTAIDTHYLVNNKPLTTKELHLQTLNAGLCINAGPGFRDRQNFTDDKENVNCKYLPQQVDRVKYLSKTLPFFSHALESDFKDLFLTIKENATTTSTYILLMVLSSLLAALGIFLNSPSVVIGAMVLAPLMSPIISLSMAVLRSDADLSRKSFSTLFTGMFIALSLSALMAYILPFQEVTNEIEGRLHPSTLDLLVAVLSGVAGAYANVRENIAKSLPGVAIAVALVPPLCVSGIGIGWMNFEIFYGAMLLFMTNLAGIIMAAGLSFMVMGFAPFSRARKGIIISVLLVAIVSVPLFLSFVNMQKMSEIKKQLIGHQYQISGQLLKLQNIKIRSGSPLKISADLLSTKVPDGKLLMALEQQLTEQLKQPVLVDFSVHLVTQHSF